MFKKLWKKFVTSLFRQQNKRLDSMQAQLDRQQKLLEQQQKLITAQQRLLKEQSKATEETREYLRRELKRRDLWPVKAAEARRLAAGRPVWVIKCPAPDNKDKILWGEYNFALALQKELTKLGIYAIVQWYEEWYSEFPADVVVVLRGGYRYRPDRRNANCKYILWLSCFTEKVTKEEFESYDLVLVASRPYAKELKQQLSVPVEPLLLCVDTERFFPQETEKEYDKVFVGNTRYVKRTCVDWCEKHDVVLKLWGRTEGKAGWKVFVKPESCVELMGGVRNEDLPELYRKSGIILNDHFEDMRQKGFLNNRVLEGLCCGRPVLSDYCEEYEELLGDSVVFYRDEQDFLEKLKLLEQSDFYTQQMEKVQAAWPLLQQEYSFEARTRQLVELAKTIE